MKRAHFQLDTSGTVQLIATGKVAPINKYDPNAAPGAPREQETDEHGVRLWVADFLIDDGGDRANCVGVRIAAEHQPVFDKFKPVQFTRLDVTVYVNKAGQLGFTYTGTLKQASAAATKAA
jgi:hypothetical protein